MSVPWLIVLAPRANRFWEYGNGPGAGKAASALALDEARLREGIGGRAGAAEQAVGAEDEHEGEHAEARDILVGAAEVAREERFEEAEGEAAEKRPGHRAEAAEQRRGERLEAEQIAHEEIGLAVLQGEGRAGDRRE